MTLTITREHTFTCDEVVVVRDKKMKVKSVTIRHYNSDQPDSDIVQGWVFVMNDAGKTINRFCLGDPPK